MLLSRCLVQQDFLLCDCESCATWVLYIWRSLDHAGPRRHLFAVRYRNKESLVNRYTVPTDFIG